MCSGAEPHVKSTKRCRRGRYISMLVEIGEKKKTFLSPTVLRVWFPEWSVKKIISRRWWLFAVSARFVFISISQSLPHCPWPPSLRPNELLQRKWWWNGVAAHVPVVHLNLFPTIVSFTLGPRSLPSSLHFSWGRTQSRSGGMKAGGIEHCVQACVC